jgi:sporulation protein YabP
LKNEQEGSGGMEEKVLQHNHKLVINNRNTSMVTGVLDVLSFDLNEVLLETELGMLMVKGSDLHVNRLSLEKGEVDLSGNIDSVSYSDVPTGIKHPENLFSKLFR